MVWIVINTVLTIGSATLIIYALFLQWQMRKLHKVNVAIALMDMEHLGNILSWRDRALAAERELRQLKGE